MYIETLNIFKYIYKHINLLANIISMNVLIALDKFYNLILDFECLQEKLGQIYTVVSGLCVEACSWFYSQGTPRELVTFPAVVDGEFLPGRPKDIFTQSLNADKFLLAFAKDEGFPIDLKSKNIYSKV